MTDQLTPDFYGANQWTPYPFTGPYDEFTKRVIDASITVPSGLQGQKVLVNHCSWTSTAPPSLEIMAGTTVVIPRSTAVIVTSFGDYQIWQLSTADAQATIVVMDTIPEVTFDSVEYEVAPSVVSWSAQHLVESVLSGANEVAGPGQDLLVLPGSHLGIESAVEAGVPVITISAEFNPDGPCVPGNLTPKRAIKSINGITPGGDGDFQFRGRGIWVVDGSTHGLSMKNLGVPCCDCQDYVDLFEKIKITHERLVKTKTWILDAQARYLTLLNYAKFLLRHQVVGGIDPADATTVQDC